jgi:hypothetical protein|tara:strand:+ start:1462 stop:1980 length:519 start_codon:yes stop_codon:yes gene_type:complete
MGMDVYGKNPKSEAGEYFRRNIWGWHPLWSYVEENHSEIADLVENGHTNDGDGLGARNSNKLAKLLLADLDAGVVADYVRERNLGISELPFDDCDTCNSTGIRTDKIGLELEMPDQILKEDIAIIVGRTQGYCNGCGGVGKKEPIQAWYRLEEADVAQFAKFLAQSGGFTIY